MPVRSARRPDSPLSQDSTDRLDRVALGAHLVDERHDQRPQGSSSPAKKIEALRRISLSSSNRRTFDLSCRISASSSLVAPRTLTAVDLGLDHPAAHGLLPDTLTARDRLSSCSQRRVLGQMLEHQTHTALLDLRIDLLRHDCASFQLRKMRHETWGASHRSRRLVQPCC